MLKKLLSYAPVQITSALSVFILIAIQTRFLSLSEYGLLALVLVFMEITRAFVAQWINTSLIRLLPAATKSEKKSIITLSFQLLIFLIVPGSISLGLCLFLADELSIFIWIALSLLLISKSFFLYFQELFRLSDNVIKYRYSVLLQAFLSVILTLLLLSYSPSILMALYALVLSNLISCLLSYNKIPSIKGVMTADKKNEFIAYGLPLLFAGVLTVLTTRIDRVIVSELLGLDAIGMYAAFSNMLLGILALIFTIVAMPLYPELTKQTASKENLFRAHQNYLDVMLIITLPATAGIALLASELIEVLLGDNYINIDLSLFYWVTFSVFCMNLRAHFIDHGLQFTLKTKVLPYIAAALLALNIISSYYFIKIYGLSGAGYALALTQIFGLLLSYTFAKRYGYNYPLPKNLLPTLIATIFMIVVFIFIRPMLATLTVYISLLYSVLISVISYAFIHLLFNTLNCRLYLKKAFK